jgi:nicotinamide riboside kinase
MIGNRLQIRDFNKAVATPEFKICICGPSGSGKTTLAKSILKRFNTLENPTLFRDIEDFIQSKKNTLIFIDDVDIGYTKTQISKITNLKTNILFTCTDKQHVLSKTVQFIKLEYPKVNEAFPYLLEKMSADVDPELLLEKTRYYKGNIREIELNMHFKSACSKFKGLTDFEIARGLLLARAAPPPPQQYKKINELVPFLMYENFGQVYGDKNFELYEKLNSDFVVSFKVPFELQNDIRLGSFINAKTPPNTDYTKFRFPELFYLK